MTIEARNILYELWSTLPQGDAPKHTNAHIDTVCRNGVMLCNTALQNMSTDKCTATLRCRVSLFGAAELVIKIKF
jgi:hypothetical protein